MPARIRSRARASAAVSSEAGRAITPPLPEYEPLSTPLNAKAQRALNTLLESRSIRDLQKHLQAAADGLTDTGGEVNEQVTRAKLRLEREKLKARSSSTAARKAKNRKTKNKRKAQHESGFEENMDDSGDDEVAEGEDGNSEDEDEDMADDEVNNDPSYEEKARKFSQFDEHVRTITVQLEEKMREMIDADVRLDGLNGIVKDIEGEATRNQTRVESARRTTRRTKRRPEGDTDTEMVDANDNDDDESQQDEDREDSPAYEEGKPTPFQALEQRLIENDSQWKSRSLTQRYSKNNTYIGFYRTIFEAKQSGDEIPPLPHSSTWFAHLEGEDRGSENLTPSTSTSPLPQRSRNTAASCSNSRIHSRLLVNTANNVEEIDDEDGDIEIDRERISLKCPLTLLPFQDPVTSTHCPHSFERQAIEDMIRRSPTTIPLPSNAQQQGTVSRRGGTNAGGGKRIKYVGCPVCSVKLTLIDLQPDPILLRRMRRAEVTLMDRDADDQLDPEGARRRRVKGGRQSGFTVASGGGSGEDGDEIVDDEDEENSHTVSVKREFRPRSRVEMIRHL